MAQTVMLLVCGLFGIGFCAIGAALFFLGATIIVAAVMGKVWP